MSRRYCRRRALDHAGTTIDLEFYEKGPIMQDIEMSDEEIDALLDEYGIDGEIL